MTPSVRAGHKRAARPKTIAMIPRKLKIHQYFETALIIDVLPSKTEYTFLNPSSLNHHVVTKEQLENTLKSVDRQGK
jgi:hypothetical protein